MATSHTISTVSIVKCKEYTNAAKSVASALKKIKFNKSPSKSYERVLLKPNLLIPLPPEKVATTHPLFVKAVIEFFQDSGCEVWVGDSSGRPSQGITEKAFKISGIEKIVDETGSIFRNFQNERFVTKKIPDFHELEKAHFAKAIFEADLIVNLPKLKTHGQTFYTGAIKNCFGCIHPAERVDVHKHFNNILSFSKSLVDIYSVVKPQLNIMDAIIGMEGDGGPVNGDPKKIGLVMASTDAVALDAVSSTVVGYTPQGIPTIRNAGERSLGVDDIKKIKIAGKRLKDVLVLNFKKNSLFGVFNPLATEPGFKKEFVFNPIVVKSKCTKCGECIVNCPVGAIVLKPYPIIDRNKCIHCYCCHELCEQCAYRLEKKILTRCYAPYTTSDNVLVLDDREYKLSMKNSFKLKPERIDTEKIISKIRKSKSEIVALYFDLDESNMNKEAGDRILGLLERLRDESISFIVMSALPRCLFGFEYDKIILDFNLAQSCENCPSLFVLQADGTTNLCNTLGKRTGPTIESMGDRNQIYQYFSTYYNTLEPCRKCVSCIYHIRRVCSGLCFRKN